ncbi:hypothetical protein [Streptomyces sp. HPF1205]|uniref:hypothetical protein n=1 Tax=Streptomyces sp. HPF1205 TaxID=2873262 RepID=UPI001CED06C5|nr:hypothetical protein [Streptomyces sp. HPF1205]
MAAPDSTYDRPSERPVLADVRPAGWSHADAASYEAAQRLLDEVIEGCVAQEATALGAPVPDLPEADRWRALAEELGAARAMMRPDWRAAVRAVRDRCLAIRDQLARTERVLGALAIGQARALTPDGGQVRYGDKWWVRYGAGYVRAPRELAGVLDEYAVALAAADAAVSAAQGEVP